MPIEHERAAMADIADTPGVLRRQTLGPDDGFGHRALTPDPATDVDVLLVLSPFDVLRRLAYMQIVGGSEDIRLWWIGTSEPMHIEPGDIFILTEEGTVVHYIVQMLDPGLYLIDTTVAVCKREEQP